MIHLNCSYATADEPDDNEGLAFWHSSSTAVPNDEARSKVTGYKGVSASTGSIGADVRCLRRLLRLLRLGGRPSTSRCMHFVCSPLSVFSLHLVSCCAMAIGRRESDRGSFISWVFGRVRFMRMRKSCDRTGATGLSHTFSRNLRGWLGLRQTSDLESKVGGYHSKIR